jgi:tryptophanyl-tRNA synthetase
MADAGIAESLAATALDPVPATDGAPPSGEQVVTPWDVQGGAGGIDYDKLLSTFGCQPINADLIARCAGCCRALAWHR